MTITVRGVDNVLEAGLGPGAEDCVRNKYKYTKIFA